MWEGCGRGEIVEGRVCGRGEIVEGRVCFVRYAF